MHCATFAVSLLQQWRAWPASEDGALELVLYNLR